MLAAVKIKEEPLDDIEDMQETFKQEESSMKQQINTNLLSQTVPLPNFHIVEEQESIITVSAAEMRSEDELQFIDSINNTDPMKFKGICSKCLKTFTNRAHFLKHTKRNHCITKQKCPVCPVTFIEASSLLNHLNLHRENYFFCSHFCGANFSTLPLCEEHEVKEHKKEVAAKFRYKHFCSFCREGFKTELQLHVHWLQQTQGCGKLMQDVVLHSTNVASNYDVNNKNSKNLLLEKPVQTTTTNSVSTIPITKLRLKSASNVSPPIANKRQIMKEPSEDNETAIKRLKTLDKIKAEIETNQLPYNFAMEDIQIKEEPLDDYETNLTNNLIPEVIIKTEEEDQTSEEKPANEKPKMKNLVINNAMIGPESNGKFIPLDSFVASENKHDEPKPVLKTFSINSLVNTNGNGKIINMNNQNLPVLKLITNNNNNIHNNTNISLKTEGNLRLVKIMPVPLTTTNKTTNNFNFSNIQNCGTGKLMSLKLANGQNLLNNGDAKPLPKSGLQIVKFLPNTQFINMKTNGSSNNNNIKKQPLIIKLQTPSTIANQTTSTNTPLTLVTTNPVITVPACPNSTTSSSSTTSSTVSIKLNSLEQNTTIDAEDFKKLQAEALIKAEEHRKNFYIPKTRLMIIENIPEKKELINNMKQQIAEVETKTTEQIQAKPMANFILNHKQTDEPPLLYLPILTTLDVSLVEARYRNPNYSYKFICPYCLKDYEIKTALKVHLNRAHNLNNRDMEKINVQAKPYLNEVLDEQQQQQLQPIEESDTKLHIKEESLTQDTDSQPLTTSESESLTADNMSTTDRPTKPLKSTNTKHQKRFVCDKCGRSCSSKTMLNDHILANCSREPQYSCKECTKKFYSHGTLQCHMTIHTGELPHKCNYCDKRFRTRGQVKVHHRTHTGERPFFCQVCSQRFTHRETLIAHLSRHIGMKRYKCYGCDKHFSCISALKTHREIRSDTCGKVKFNPRAIGPRVRVIRGNVIFEPQPEINPYLKSEDPKSVLTELQNHDLLDDNNEDDVNHDQEQSQPEPHSS